MNDKSFSESAEDLEVAWKALVRDLAKVTGIDKLVEWLSKKLGE